MTRKSRGGPTAAAKRGLLPVLLVLAQIAGIAMRTVIAAAEAVLLRNDVSQLALRRLATGMGGVIACSSLLVLSCVRSSRLLAVSSIPRANAWNKLE